MKKTDILFVGHLCYDEIRPYQGEKTVSPGSAVLCGAMAAVRTGKNIAIFTRASKEDDNLLNSIREDGIEVFIDYSPVITLAGVTHPSANVDERHLYIYKSAEFMNIEKFPEIKVRHIHLAGISNLEFTMDFIKEAKNKAESISVDMQSFIRQVNRGTGEIVFGDVKEKAEIAALMDFVKLDIVEAKILTGYDDLEKAAIQFEEWGTKETLITQAGGVLARVNGTTYYEKFTNRSSVGRTGRGDTTFAAYLCARLDHDVKYALKFAAALVSVKMETPGPFKGTMDEVISRMNHD